MGSPTTRITAAEFLTPPEFHAFSLAADGAGRIGGARIELIGDPVRTNLGHCYQQVPVRVLPPFHFGADQPALVYLLSPTAGLMDGDAQLIEIHAATGTRAVIVGQSATRIHPCLQGFSTQQWRIRVEAGAVLVVLPGPAIPFERSRYFQHVSVDLAAGAHFVWADVWFAGRYARDAASEQFRFTALVQELTVRREGNLVYRDRFAWRGPWDRETAAWHFSDALAAGSVFVTGPADETAEQGGVRFATAAGDGCVRFQGESEAVTAGVVRTALLGGARRAVASSQEAWLLPTGHLAPNHWFSPVGDVRQSNLASRGLTPPGSPGAC